MEIDNNLRRLRLQQGLKVRELAVTADVSTGTLNSIERYGDFPSAKTRAKLANALKVSESMIWPHLRTPLEVNDGK